MTPKGGAGLRERLGGEGVHIRSGTRQPHGAIDGVGYA